MTEHCIKAIHFKRWFGSV